MANFSVADLTDDEKSQLRGARKRKMELIEEIEQIKNELRDLDQELESLYYVDEGSRPRHKLMLAGRKKFNADAQKGVEFLVDRGLLENTPEAVAQWLYTSEGLRKASIGDLLGQHDDFSLAVLDAFVKLHNLAHLPLVDALRQFLWTFRLPGESQKIDRIMDKFAAHYCTANPEVFDKHESCFVLSYSCIMLNTLLHNPSVKDRPNFERYANMNKELLDEGAVARETLQGIYDSIRTQEFKFPEDDSGRLSDLFLHPEREGWLYKQSSSQFISGPLSWKRRWFVLSEACLYYFEQTTDKEPRGIIPLQNVGVRPVDGGSRPHTLEIYSLNDDRIKARLELQLRDARWQRGVEPWRRRGAEKKEQEGEQAKTEQEQHIEEYDPFKEAGIVCGEKFVSSDVEDLDESSEGEAGDEERAASDEAITCTSCKCTVSAERDQLHAHYRGAWHLHNVRRHHRGQAPIGEEDYEAMIDEEEEEGQRGEGEEEEEDAGTSVGGNARAYFVQDGDVLSAWRCVLRAGEREVSRELFTRPLDAAIFLLSGGHFSGAVFKGDKMVAHRSHRRYTVRAKQGGAQGASDGRGGPAHSAGAALRRYNERMLRQEVQAVLVEWREWLAACPLLFIRCPSYQRGVFVGDGAAFDKGDARLRTLPFETRRPTLDEVRRSWTRLGVVARHGKREEWERQMEEEGRRREPRRALRQKRDDGDLDLEALEREEEEREQERRTREAERGVRKVEMREEAVREREERNEWPSVSVEQRRELYTAVREDDVAAVEARVKEDSTVLDFMARHGHQPNGYTLFHHAASRGSARVCKLLLDRGVVPLVKADGGEVPYQVAANKLIKSIFCEWRDSFGDREPEGFTWKETQVPEKKAVDPEKLEREKEAKKRKKAAQKERQRAKKEEEAAAAEEQRKKDAYMALSDREKRALAAEARLARLENTAPAVRCFQCAIAVTGKPFEYNDNKFCSPACVQLHRKSGGEGGGGGGQCMCD